MRCHPPVSASPDDIPTEGSRLVFLPSIPALSTYGRCSVTLLQRQPRYSIDFAILSIRFGASHVSEALLRSGSRLPPMFLVCDATHHARLAVSKDPKIFISPRFMIISTSTALRLHRQRPEGRFSISPECDFSAYIYTFELYIDPGFLQVPPWQRYHPWPTALSQSLPKEILPRPPRIGMRNRSKTTPAVAETIVSGRLGAVEFPTPPRYFEHITGFTISSQSADLPL